MCETFLQLTPLRSLNDFALESARFQLPAFNDFEKWGNRVVKNFLYYQTNYFVLWALVFTLIGLVHPGKIILGEWWWWCAGDLEIVDK